ncbi:MAG TPA: metallophosphoesterase [Candidatus Aenigmarchaeota archaeon]|nr:MAG: metallophosphoesterase [Candidatus Aenigmarchaeota archaeon]HDD46153.1 metallophosphoesterase [Candidatus Aenigmarchaeota archaeon]
MKILVLPDIHGEIERLVRILAGVDVKKIDLIISQGDFTDMYNVPEGFSQIDTAELIVQKLVSTKRKVLCVPGNHDPYEIVSLFEEYNINLHAKVREIGNICFIGFGGAQTPFHTRFEPSEEEITETLEGLVKNIKKEFVLVVHAPPYNTKLDTVKGKHVGSKAIRIFIEKAKPRLVLTAHIHENHGVERIGTTKVFYPGPVFENRYGIVNIKDDKIECKECTI